MKGSSGALLSVVIIMLLAMIVAFVADSAVISAGLKANVENRFAIRHEIHTSDNALKSARIYMKTAAEYSFYQAVYDVFRQGGFSDPGEGRTYNYWHDTFGGVDIPSEDDVLGAIQANTGRNLNIYAKAGYNFMSDYSVFIPEYTVTLEDAVTEDGKTIDTPLETFYLTATGENMVIVKEQPTGEIISMESKSFLNDTLNVDVKGLYETGKSLLPEIVSDIEEGMKAIRLPASCPDSYSASTEAEKEKVKEEIMAITIPVPQETGYSFDMSMVHSDAKRSPGTTPADLCRHTLLGVARVRIKAEETSIPILNEDGPNFAPVELAFLVRYAFTSTGEAPTEEGFDTEPAPEEITPPEDYAPPEVVIGGTLPKVCRDNHDYDAYMEEASRIFDVDVGLIRAMICLESEFDPEAVSRKEAVGLIQIMPITSAALGDPTSDEGSHCKAKAAEKGLDWAKMASEYSTDDPRLDPEENILRGVCYISWIRDKNLPALKKDAYNKLSDMDKIRCMLAGYNAGTGIITSAMLKAGCTPESINIKDTRDYVAYITSWAGIATA